MAFDIDLQFNDHGISPANVEICTLADSSKGIKFTDNDFFIIEPCSGEFKTVSLYNKTTREDEQVFDQNYFEYFNGYPSGSSIETSFTYVGLEIGSILRYGYAGFLVVRFYNGVVGLYRAIDQSLVNIGRDAPCVLVPNTIYKVKIEDNQNRIIVSLNDIVITSFVTNDNEPIEQGLFGVFASKDNICNKYNIKAQRPDNWLSHGSPTVFGYEMSMDNPSYLVVSCLGDNTLESNYAYQQIASKSNFMYSLLFKAGGKSNNTIATNPGKIVVVNASTSAIISSNVINFSEEYSTQEYKVSFTVPTGCSTIEVRIIPSSSSTLGLDFLQTNEGCQAPFAETLTSIVTTNKSIANLPISLTKMNGLTISFNVKPYSNSSDVKNVLMSFPNADNTKSWVLYYDVSNLLCIDYIFDTTINSFVTPIIVDIGLDNTISVSFIDNSIQIETETYEKVVIETQIDKDPTTFDIISQKVYFPNYVFSKIYLGYCERSGYARANSSFDFLMGTDTNIEKFLYTFNGSVQESTGSISATMIGKPTQYSPISVQYNDGTPLSRISSFDSQGNYTKVQIEYISYAGLKKIVVSCSEIDNQYEVPIIMYTENEGRKNQLIHYFNCNKVDGNIIYIDMTDEESSDFIGKPFVVRYCPSNSYSVQYNDDDTFKIVMHSNKGKPVNVSYDHASVDQSLVKSAIMNPFYNPNHSGFLYLTDEVEPTSYLDILVTPNYLDAKKQEYALVIIDAIDKRGNIVSDANISITSKKEIGSTITLLSTGKDINDALTLAKVDMKFFAGRYVYKYSINKDYGSSNGYILKDTLTITENNSKIIDSTSIYIYV